MSTLHSIIAMPESAEEPAKLYAIYHDGTIWVYNTLRGTWDFETTIPNSDEEVMG